MNQQHSLFYLAGIGFARYGESHLLVNGQPNANPGATYTWAAKLGFGGDTQVNASHGIRWAFFGLPGPKPDVSKTFDGGTPHFIGTLTYVNVF